MPEEREQETPAAPSRALDRAQGDFEEVKREFSRQALQEALTFMRRDNDVVASLASITDTLARYVESNPRAAMELAQTTDAAATGAALEAREGRNFFQCLKDLILGDKEFIRDIIKCILN